ncbi:hypothetical protein L195_g004440 [Trifolium pratense]|uniref:Uncharacterized protein n=1 Tax=Trifolium pratense TaxID=57577 RepID=A0A2K3NY12_TRIPR|nr:hypothetical protein L195_g004440 [Trifolium pratense]
MHDTEQTCMIPIPLPHQWPFKFNLNWTYFFLRCHSILPSCGCPSVCYYYKAITWLLYQQGLPVHGSSLENSLAVKVKRFIRYLAGTQNLGMHFFPSSTQQPLSLHGLPVGNSARALYSPDTAEVICQMAITLVSKIDR